jgi:hypothetical protein
MKTSMTFACCRSVRAPIPDLHRNGMVHPATHIVATDAIAPSSYRMRRMTAAASLCISHDHAEVLGMSSRITSARFVAARRAGRIALTGLGRFGTLSRK